MALIGPSGCGKSTFIRALNRMHDFTPGARVDGHVLLDGNDIYGARHRSRDDPPIVSAWFFSGPIRSRNRSSTTSCTDRAFTASETPTQLMEICERSLRQRRALGRSQRSARSLGARAFGRPAAAALHRALPRRRSRSDSDGRAGFGARPDRDQQDRRSDRRSQESLYRRDRDALDAAGRPYQRQHGLLSASATWSRPIRRRRSSPNRRTNAPRTTSPGASGRPPGEQPPALRYR